MTVKARLKLIVFSDSDFDSTITLAKYRKWPMVLSTEVGHDVGRTQAALKECVPAGSSLRSVFSLWS